MNSSQLSNEDSDTKLLKVFNKLKNDHHSKISHKELKKVKQEKESLIVQLSESHDLIDSLRSENTMLFNIIDSLEIKLKDSIFSSDNLKSMMCIHSDISNKPDLVVDDLSASTSHVSDSELDSFIIEPVIVDTACLDNSCLNDCVMPKSKDTGTQAHGKFVPTCHNCGKIGHIRPNCCLLKSHRPWIKQDAMRKCKVEDSSSSKYVPPHRRHIEGKGTVMCKNANHNFAENVKKHSNKRSLPTCHHCGITGHIRPKCPQLQKLKVQRKLPIRATPPMALQALRHQQKFVPANQSGKSRHYKRKPHKPNGSHAYEGLLNLIQGMLRRMDNMGKTCKLPPRVKQVWVRKDVTIHPLSGSGLT
jgi:hypothetical protein